LGREVALKVLPEEFTRDPERLARFEREAKLLAQLNHPNIAQIYALEKWGQLPVSAAASADSGVAKGKSETVPIFALAMELVEGPTLAERLEGGPFSFRESLSVALQIAQALEEAHEKGIVHRDLKPQNIKASTEGKVKVLDFGLAKAMEPVSPAGMSPHDLAHSPTVTFGGTREGVILGTAAYMSPEQARGGAVDKRADIWAFGVVLYEMLAGERLFAEGSVVDTLSAVLRQEIDLGRLPAGLPPRVRELVRRCFERDPKRRLRDIGEARLALESGGAVLDVPSEPLLAPPARSAAAPQRSRWAAIGFATAIVAAAVGLWLERAGPPAPESAPAPRALRATIPLPPGLELDGVGSPVLALSADGSTLAFLARRENAPQRLYVRRLDENEAREVPGSETGEGPIFSPDGKWVGFAVGVSLITGGVPPELRKHSLETGLTQTICALEDYFGGLWREDGTILFVNTSPGGLWSVSASGGTARRLVERFVVAGRETAKTVAWPNALPGGNAVLLTDWDVSQTGELIAVELGSREVRPLGLAGSAARYLPIGHLAFGRAGGALEVVRFDPRSLRVVGAPVATVAELAFARHATPAFAVGDDGTLVYTTGFLRNSRREPMRLVRADRSGRRAPLPVAADLYGRPLAVSPDGRRLAATTWDGVHIVVDLDRGTRVRLPGAKLAEVLDLRWTRDGRQLTYPDWTAGEVTGHELAVQPVDGGGAPRPLGVAGSELSVAGWTPDGRTVVYETNDLERQLSRIFAVELDPEALTVRGTPRELWSEPTAIVKSTVSPDGRFVAFDSDASGRFEIYLLTMATRERIALTAGGGRSPSWSADSREDFFRRDDAIWAVGLEPAAGGGLRIGGETKLFDWPEVYAWDAGADGASYGTEPVPGAAVQTSLQLRTGWLAEVERLAGPGAGR
jgi:serine/threonine-protein kinase